MKVVVTSSGTDLEAQVQPNFGRCPIYIFVDTETLQFEAVENPAANAAGGAGIRAAQFVVERGAQAVVTGNVGPNASQVFESAGVPAAGPGGYCVCPNPNCGHREPHQAGVPCYQKKCPKCGTQMIRE